jgi:alpha-L-arabinofuranosidase
VYPKARAATPVSERPGADRRARQEGASAARPRGYNRGPLLEVPMRQTKTVHPWWLAGLLLAGAAARANEVPPPPLSVQIVVRADEPRAVINPNLYGQFAEHLGRGIYGGLWVGEDSRIPNTRGLRNDVVRALKQLHVPVIRWPGGCFADEYHWKDGVGPRDQRPAIINTNWGGVAENNAFGTHEFLDLCEQLGAEPYISGNLGSGTPQEMMEWVEYMTSDAQSPMANWRRKNGRDKPWKVKYFAVGNENWGCGGNMRPEFYADNYRRYATFLKNYAGNQLFRVACGASEDDYRWTQVVMSDGRAMDGISLHHYTVPNGNWEKKGSATRFDVAAWHATLRGALRMDELIRKHLAVMDPLDPKHKVALLVDEWGVWTDAEPGSNPAFLFQQNSLRDALLAALHLHVFQDHADRVAMANIAQMVNVLQAMVLTDGKKMLLTPTYHVFEMLQVHQGARSLPVTVSAEDYVLGGQRLPSVSASASRDGKGKVHLSLVNTLPAQEQTIVCEVRGSKGKQVSGRILTGPVITAHNTFTAPNTVAPKPFLGARLVDGKLQVQLPARSVVMLELE